MFQIVKESSNDGVSVRQDCNRLILDKSTRFRIDEFKGCQSCAGRTRKIGQEIFEIVKQKFQVNEVDHKLGRGDRAAWVEDEGDCDTPTRTSLPNFIFLIRVPRPQVVIT